jgi:hypothetical protein
MKPNPGNLPKPKPHHARTPDGYVTWSAGMRPTAPVVRKPRTDEVVDSNGMVTRMVTSPQAVRVSPTPVVNPVRKVSAPVVSRVLTGADLDEARATLTPHRGTKRSPFSS